MSVNRIIRYAGRLACISDYRTKTMGKRTDFSKDAIIQALKELAGEREKKIEELWSTLTTSLPGIKNQQILDYEPWDENAVKKYYQIQAREILATESLIDNFEKNKSDLFGVAQLLNIYVWRFKHILEFRERLPWTLVLAIERLKYKFTFAELSEKWEEVKNGFNH